MAGPQKQFSLDDILNDDDDEDFSRFLAPAPPATVQPAAKNAAEPPSLLLASEPSSTQTKSSWGSFQEGGGASSSRIPEARGAAAPAAAPPPATTSASARKSVDIDDLLGLSRKKEPASGSSSDPFADLLHKSAIASAGTGAARPKAPASSGADGKAADRFKDLSDLFAPAPKAQQAAGVVSIAGPEIRDTTADVTAFRRDFDQLRERDKGAHLTQDSNGIASDVPVFAPASGSSSLEDFRPAPRARGVDVTQPPVGGASASASSSIAEPQPPRPPSADFLDDPFGPPKPNRSALETNNRTTAGGIVDEPLVLGPTSSVQSGALPINAPQSGSGDTTKAGAADEKHDREREGDQFFRYDKSFWSAPEEWCFFHENCYTTTTSTPAGVTTASSTSSSPADQAAPLSKGLKKSAKAELDRALDECLGVTGNVVKTSNDFYREKLVRLSRGGGSASSRASRIKAPATTSTAFSGLTTTCAAANDRRQLLCFGTSSGSLILYDCRRQAHGVLVEGTAASDHLDGALHGAASGSGAISFSRGATSLGASASTSTTANGYARSASSTAAGAHQSSSGTSTPSLTSSLAFSSDGSLLLVGHANGALTLWLVDSGKLLILVPNLLAAATSSSSAAASRENASTASPRGANKAGENYNTKQRPAPATSFPQADEEIQQGGSSIVAVGFKPNSRTEAIAADGCGGIYYLVFRAMFGLDTQVDVHPLGSKPELGVCLRCLPLEPLQFACFGEQAREVFSSSGNTGRGVCSAGEQLPDGLPAFQPLSMQQYRNVDNLGVMLLVTTHALVLLSMHPKIERLQREIFRDYRDEVDASADVDGEQLMPLPDACWIRAPGAPYLPVDLKHEASGGASRKRFQKAGSTRDGRQRSTTSDQKQLFQGAMLVASLERMVIFYSLELVKQDGVSAAEHQAMKQFRWQLIPCRKLLFPDFGGSAFPASLHTVRALSSSTFFALDTSLRAHFFQLRNRQTVCCVESTSDSGELTSQILHSYNPVATTVSGGFGRPIGAAAVGECELPEEPMERYFVFLHAMDYSQKKLAYHKNHSIPAHMVRNLELRGGGATRKILNTGGKTATTEKASDEAPEDVDENDNENAKSAASSSDDEGGNEDHRDLEQKKAPTGGRLQREADARCYHQTVCCLVGYHHLEDISLEAEETGSETPSGAGSGAGTRTAAASSALVDGSSRAGSDRQQPGTAGENLRGRPQNREQGDGGRSPGSSSSSSSSRGEQHQAGFLSQLRQKTVANLAEAAKTTQKAASTLSNTTQQVASTMAATTREAASTVVATTREAASTVVATTREAASTMAELRHTLDPTTTGVNASVVLPACIAGDHIADLRGSTLGGAQTRPIFLCTSEPGAAVVQAELSSWISLVSLLLGGSGGGRGRRKSGRDLGSARWEELLRIFVDVYDGRLTPLLDFPVDDRERAALLRGRLGMFLTHFLDFKLDEAKKLAEQHFRKLAATGGKTTNGAQQTTAVVDLLAAAQPTSAPPQAPLPATEVARLMKRTVETVIAVCLKCDLYQPLYHDYFARLGTKKSKLYFVDALERWLLLENGFVKELDAEVYSAILDAYSNRLQTEEDQVAQMFQQADAGRSRTSSHNSPRQGFLSVPDFLEKSKHGALVRELPFHIANDQYLNTKLGEDQVDFFPAAFASALHLTRLVISSDVFRLDLNLAVRILTQFRCYTALVHVYLGTGDFVTPLEILVGECTRIWNRKRGGATAPQSHNFSAAIPMPILPGAGSRDQSACAKSRRLFEPALCEFLLVRKLFHFLTTSFAGGSFLAGSAFPTLATMKQSVARVFMRRKTDAEDAPPDLFQKLLDLSPLSIFRALSQLVAGNGYGLFRECGFSASAATRKIYQVANGLPEDETELRPRAPSSRIENHVGGRKPALAAGARDTYFREDTSTKAAGRRGAPSSEEPTPVDALLEEVQVAFRQWTLRGNRQSDVEMKSEAIRYASTAYVWFWARAVAHGHDLSSTSTLTSLSSNESVQLQRAVNETGFALLSCLLDDTLERYWEVLLHQGPIEAEQLCVAILKRITGINTSSNSRSGGVERGVAAAVAAGAGAGTFARAKISRVFRFWNPFEGADTTSKEQHEVDERLLIAKAERRSFLKLVAVLHERRDDWREAVEARLRLYDLQLKKKTSSSASSAGATTANDCREQSAYLSSLFDYVAQLFEEDDVEALERLATEQHEELSDTIRRHGQKNAARWNVFVAEGYALLKRLERIDRDRTCQFCLQAADRLSMRRLRPFLLGQQGAAAPVAVAGPAAEETLAGDGRFGGRRTASSDMEEGGGYQTVVDALEAADLPELQIRFLDSVFASATSQQTHGHAPDGSATTPAVSHLSSYVVSFTRLMCRFQPEHVFRFLQKHEKILPVEETLAVVLGFLPKEQTRWEEKYSSVVDGAKLLLEKVGDYDRSNAMFVSQFVLAATSSGATSRGEVDAEYLKRLVNEADRYCGRCGEQVGQENMANFWFSLFDAALHRFKVSFSAAQAGAGGNEASSDDEVVLECVCRKMIRHLPASYCLRRIGGSATTSPAGGAEMRSTTAAAHSLLSVQQQQGASSKYAAEPFYVMKTPLSVMSDAVRFHARFLEASVNIVGADILLGMTEVYAANRKGLFAGGRAAGAVASGGRRGSTQKDADAAGNRTTGGAGVNYVIAGDKIRVQMG